MQTVGVKKSFAQLTNEFDGSWGSGGNRWAFTKLEDADDELVFICLNAAHLSC